MSSPILFSSLDEWASAVAALPADGGLPQRTVIVPSERHAHALRRELIRSGEARVLAGTRFLAPGAAAVAVLEAASVPFSGGEEALRPARLLALFRETLPLQHFDPGLLRSTPGWDQAFADAIRDLEAAGLCPADLPTDDAALADLALLWSRIAADAATSWSAARVQREATTLLARHPGAWPFRGATLAAVTGHETATAARFVTAIPGVTLAFRMARPRRPRDADRVRRLYGPAIAEAVARGGQPRRAPVTEREVLATYLFERPEIIASRRRPLSSGPDGTLQLEEHAGVEAEVEAAASWVSRKVLEGVALEDIAVLVAGTDPLSQLVADRIEALEVGGAPVPVHVAGGLPAASTTAGARVLAVIRAVSAHLAAHALAPVLPALRIDGSGRAHLTHGEAMELAYSLGTVGGNAANPRAALEWSARAAARIGELDAALQRARTDDDSSSREVRRLERTRRNLAAIRPALDAFVGVARAVVEDAPLAAVWDVLSGFLARWLLMPGEGAAIPARLSDALAGICAGSLGTSLKGREALAVVEEHVLSMRVPRRRFGEPAVYVGSVGSAAGLEFRAVRVVGLCEGVLPSQAHENPVLPEHTRELLESGGAPRVLPRAADRVSQQLHGLSAAVAAAREEIVLSAPHVDVARTEREPSALFIEAAAAVARPNAVTGEPARPVPKSSELVRDYFEPARRDAAAFAATHPVSQGAWLRLAAGPAAAAPPEWQDAGALALDRVRALAKRSGLGPADGVLPRDAVPFPVVPGLDPSRPLSASALQQLLGCPRMFLMRRILGWEDPAGAPSLREIDAAPFGSLLHRVVEEFYRAHGEAFVAHEKSIAQWKRSAAPIAERLFGEFLSEYPLVGARVREKELERLLGCLDAFLEYDWTCGKDRRFVGVELGFGDGTPLPVKAGGLTLQLHGFIDRVDVQDGVTVVRDLKSGAPHLRQKPEQDPTPGRDVQLGVYVLAAKRLAPSWGAPTTMAGAYAYANGRGDVEERAFRRDCAALEEATSSWLATAARMLDARSFPPTPDEDDCTYCSFRPLCGSCVPARAAAALRREDDDTPLGLFRSMKLGEEDGE